tara:strand:+ start:688 stop:798 length:111 start_codon:yes stop_codon:yes gene_type:complete
MLKSERGCGVRIPTIGQVEARVKSHCSPPFLAIELG